jgi:hypothetical protein
MLLKDAEYESCPQCHCRGKMIHDAVYGCDQCKKTLDGDQKDYSYLRMTIFHHSKDTADHDFCSWKCCVKFLRSSKVKSDYFVNLPFLHYDTDKKGLRAKDFLAFLK